MMNCYTDKIIFKEKFDNINEIAFHGTCSYYSEKIESSGFEKGATIPTQNQIDKLIQLLEVNHNYKCLNQIIQYPLLPPEKISQAIKTTFENVKSNEYEFSMTKNFDSALTFLSDEYKGGQYLKNIKTVVKGIKELGSIEIPIEIIDLIKFIDEIEKSKGVIYAINIKDIEYEIDDYRIQTKEDISVNRIISKYMNE